jgi:hypothetical protein
MSAYGLHSELLREQDGENFPYADMPGTEVMIPGPQTWSLCLCLRWARPRPTARSGWVPVGRANDLATGRHPCSWCRRPDPAVRPNGAPAEPSADRVSVMPRALYFARRSVSASSSFCRSLRPSGSRSACSKGSIWTFGFRSGPASRTISS